MGPINVQPLRIGLDKMVDRQLMDTLVQMKDRHRDRLMAIPGVNGLGVGFVFKDGERTDELASLYTSMRNSPRTRLTRRPDTSYP